MQAEYSRGLVYLTHHHIYKLQTLSYFASSITEVQVLARRVFIGSRVVYVDYVHGGESSQVSDSNTGSHATLQGYSVPHYTFLVCSTAFSEHILGNSTLDKISVGIFD